MIDYSKRSKKRTVKKRCAKCGQVGYYTKGQRHCLRRKFGVGSYCCWGDLAPVRKPSPPAPTSESQRVERFRAMTGKQLAKAQQTLKVKRRRLATAERLVAKWEARVNRLTREAALTDEEIDARRQRAQKAAQESARMGRIRRRLLGKQAEGETRWRLGLR